MVAIACPCVSVARVASSTGLSCLLMSLPFAVVYVTGIVGTMVGTTYYYEPPDDPHGFMPFVVFSILKLVVLLAGPFASSVCMMVDYVHENNRRYTKTDYTAFYLLLPSIASDIVFACAAQLVRNRHRRRIGVPADGIWRVLFNTMCCIWYNLGSTATSSSLYKSVTVGALDTIPPYEPSEKQTCSVV